MAPQAILLPELFGRGHRVGGNGQGGEDENSHIRIPEWERFAAHYRPLCSHLILLTGVLEQRLSQVSNALDISGSQGSGSEFQRLVTQI